MTSMQPPLIKQSFSPDLLSFPIPFFSSKDLWRMYLHWKKKYEKRLRGQPRNKQICEQLEREFLDLYGRTIAKEKECEGKKNLKTKAMFYSPKGFGGRNRDLFERLRFRS